MSCTIVLGCYRSGTSAIAGVLHHLGIFMGDRFQVANANNPQGYFEDLNFMECHVHMLEGRDEWREHYQNLIAKRESEQAHWGVKDPRLCMLLSTLVENLTGDHRIITTNRSMTSICQSMAKAIGYTESKTFLPLVTHLLKKREEHLQRYKGPVLQVEYTNLVFDPETEVQRIAKFVSMPCNDRAIDSIQRSSENGPNHMRLSRTQVSE